MSIICHITTVHNRFDDRIFFKQCRSLAAAGHQVFLVAPGEGRVVEDAVTFVPIRVPGGRLARMLSAGRIAMHVALTTKADVFHLHDPELLPIAIKLKSKGRKVIFDMHELVHSQLLDKQWLGPLWVRRLFASVYARTERRAVGRLDAIILAEERYQDDMFVRYPDHVEKFHLIRNLPVLSIIDRSTAQVVKGKAFTLVYVGGLSEVRGIKEVIQAMEFVPDVQLTLLGSWSSTSYEQICLSLPASDRVNYIGQVRMDQVFDHIRSADIGVCMLYPLGNYTVSEPVKAYEYMACRIPMLMSDFPFWKERFGRYSFFSDPYEPKAIASAITQAIKNTSQRIEMAIAGRAAVEGGLCWEREQELLVDLYHRLTT